MHFYPHNISDFNNATRHLTRVERSVYRDAIELYYDTESPLQADNFDKLCRVLLCNSNEEKEALRSVLDEFFTLTDMGHYHERCEREIEKYRSNSTAKARAGKASAEARKNKRLTPVQQQLNSVEQNINHEIRNNNQETEKKDKPTGKPLVTFSRWIEIIKEQNEKPIPEDSPIFEYAKDAGIDPDYLRLAWVEFKARYTDDNKRYKDWRAVFSKAVRGNWFKLWWHDGSGYQLTTLGQQNMAAMKNRDKREQQ